MPLTHDRVRVDKLQHPFNLTSRSPGVNIAKKLNFPASPAFVYNYKKHVDPKLPLVTDVLSSKNVPLNLEEQTFYKIKQ